MKKALLQTALLLSAGAIGLQAQQDVRIGLVAYYPLTTVTDTGSNLITPDLVSGYDMLLSNTAGNTMTTNNFVTVTPSSTSGPDFGLPLSTEAVSFNGQQWLQYEGETNGTTALPISYNPSFSVLFWVSGPSQSSGGQDRIISETDYVQGNTLPINSISAASGNFQLFNRIQGPVNDTTWTYNTAGRTGLDSTWHHVAWVVSNSVQYVYVDDILTSLTANQGQVNGPNGYNVANPNYNAANSPVNLTTVAGLIRFGSGGPSFADLYTGQVTDLAFWNRALSRTEVGNVMSNSINTNGLAATANPGGTAYYFAIQPVGNSNALTGSSHSFTGVADGPPYQGGAFQPATPFTYQWYYDGNPMSDDGVNIFGSQTAQLTVSNLNSASNNGTYTVVATANSGVLVTSTPALLNVSGFIPFFASYPVGTTNLWVGDTWTLTALALFDPGSTVAYQWTYDGNPLTDGTNANGAVISGSQTPTLTLTDMDPTADSGSYVLTAYYTNSSTGNGSISTSPVALAVQGSETINLTNGLIAYWPLYTQQGTKTPDLLNGYDMNVTGTFANATAHDGSTNAMLFSGSDYCTRVDASSDLLPAQGYPAFTTAFWIQDGTQAPSASAYTAFAEGSSTGGNPFMLLGVSTSGLGLHSYYRNNVTGNGGVPNTTQDPVFDGNWHHVVYVQRPYGTNYPGNIPSSSVNSSNVMCLFYVDGQLDPEGPFFNWWPLTNATLPVMNTESIGTLFRNGGTAYSIVGAMSDVAVWDRPLSPAEVSQLYASGLPAITPNIPLMTISSFTADSPAVHQGDSIRLWWNTSAYATQISIDQGVGSVLSHTVSGVGSVTVTNLQQSKTYTLTVSRGTNIVTAQITVGVLTGINTGWKPIETFDEYSAGSMQPQASPWWHGSSGSCNFVLGQGANRLLQVGPTNNFSGDNSSYPAPVFSLEGNTVVLNQTVTLFFRFITGDNIMDTTGTNVDTTVDQTVGLTDWGGIRWWGDEGGDIGPDVFIGTDSGVLAIGAQNGYGAATEWATAANGATWADSTPLVLSNNTVYDVWLDVTNSDYTTGYPAMYSIWLAPENNLANQTEVFANYTSNRDPGTDADHPQEVQNLAFMFVGGFSEDTNNVPQIMLDDFYLNTNGYNHTVPRPYGLTTVQGMPPVVTISPVMTNGQVRLYWSGGAVASAPDLTGPWTPLSGGTTNVPYYMVTPSAAQQFFRTQ